jgi:cytochrome c peroxidase
MFIRLGLGLFTLSFAALAACGDGRRDGDGEAVAPSSALALAASAPSPANNPGTEAKVELGRLLFWDPILSGEGDVACATCHHPSTGYTDGRALSIGVGGRGFGPGRQPSAPLHQTNRSSMTVLDTAFNGLTASGATDPLEAPMFWDSRARSLEQQARGPITALDEMRGPSFDEKQIFPVVVARLEAIPDYASRFASTYGAITDTAIVQAIAAFERTLIDHDSSYDRWARGDASGMTAAQLRGLSTFNDNGCARCHSGPMFSDYKVHRLGVPGVPGGATDPGVGGGFRTASLRNVTRTAPYMHDGAFATLDQVFQFYNRVNERLDPLLDDLRAPQRGDAADVKAFFEAISDGTFDATIPSSVPSGLVPGGGSP